MIKIGPYCAFFFKYHKLRQHICQKWPWFLLGFRAQQKLMQHIFGAQQKSIWPTWVQSQDTFLGPRNDFPKFNFWTVKFFLVKKVTYIQIVTHPYLARLSENMLEVLHDDIGVLAECIKWDFFLFGTQKSTDSHWGHLG